ncbi:InlB B-repeat-containing protein, partial [Bifidobacterium indicum]|uniref:RCC1 domain-containing protein n=2 Tax=Bifidobacterium indicum TaxID=1691 RepID=UPI0030D7936E
FTRPVTQDTTITAHWTKTGQWTISPDHGPKAGGTTVTLTPPPASGIRFSQTSAGGNFSMGIDSKGDLYTWGDNSFGQLGRDTTGTPADRPGRVTAPAGVTFTQASAGDHSSLALGSDGNLYTWGANDWGQLGRDTDTTINETKADRKPGQVALPAGASSSFTWTKATTRWDHTLAFGSDGKLYAWGRNQGGQLGNATIPSGNNNSKAYSARPVLVSVPGGVAFSEVSTGHLHSLALSTNGALYAWGQNSYGMLGMDDVSIGSVVNTPKAVRNTAGVAFTQISAGSSSCLAISSDGSLYAWGDNSDGQLGLGDTAARLTPTQVTKPSAKFWKEASIRDGYSLALSSDGSLYAWGQNTYGQLGIPSGSSNDDILKPTTVGNPSDTPQGFNWMQAHTGWQHSLAIGSDGNLYTWGSSSNGKLGRDTGTAPADRPGRVAFPSRGKPTRVLFDRVQGTGSTPGADGTWTVTTPEHAAGRVPVTISWTLDGTPQADDTSNTYRYEGPAYTVTFKADGGTPATRTQQVTEGDTATRPATDPTRDGYQFDGWFTGTTPVAYDFTRPVTGNTTITAHWTKGDGRWTINPDHGPDTGDTTVTLTPPPARGIRFSQTSAGALYSMGIDSKGDLYTWGSNGNGQLGRDTGSSRDDRPGRVTPPTGITSFTQTSAGYGHSVAVGSDGNLYTWGNNGNGQLGRDTGTTPADRPGRVTPPTGITFTQASAGGWHSMAIGSNGNLYTWGYNGYGQLGRDGTLGTPGPVLTDADVTFTQTNAGYWHSMAVGSDGNLYTWGSGSNGKLGRDTSSTPANRPGRVVFPSRGTPTRVLFDRLQSTVPTAGADDTWTVTTPAHTAGGVPVTISWTLDGTPQADDTGNTYRYVTIGSLPLTGSHGILLLAAIGLTLMTATDAARRHRHPTHTSHE